MESFLHQRHRINTLIGRGDRSTVVLWFGYERTLSKLLFLLPFTTHMHQCANHSSHYKKLITLKMELAILPSLMFQHLSYIPPFMNFNVSLSSLCLLFLQCQLVQKKLVPLHTPCSGPPQQREIDWVLFCFCFLKGCLLLKLAFHYRTSSLCLVDKTSGAARTQEHI